MIIKNIKLIKNNLYELTEEKGNTFLLFDETILKYRISKEKEISSAELKEIKKYDELMKIYLAEVKSVKRKLKSSYEIKKKYNSLKEDEKDLLLTKLTKAGYVNDELYITSFVNDQVNLTKNGPSKIKRKLIELGFEEENINIYLKKIPEEIWIKKLRKVIAIKSKSNKKYSEKVLYNKIKLYLISLGYNSTLIESNLFITNQNEEEILKKDYNKLLKKYQRKNISEKEMSYKIKYDLMKKGYDNNLIEIITKENSE